MAQCYPFQFFSAVSPNGSVRAQSSLFNTRIGDMVMLSCTAQGGPGNQFTWMIVNTTVSNSPDFILNVNSALDGGLYTCQVHNEAGFGEDSLIINGTQVTTTS